MSDTLHKTVTTIKKNELSLMLLRTLCLVVLVLAGLGAYRIYKDIYPTPYVSKSDGFKIVFNQNPTVNKLAPQKEADGEITGNIYTISNKKTGTIYAVYVTSYPHADFSSLSKDSTIETLNSEIETLAKNEQAKLSNGQELSFKGLTAVEADLTPTNHSEAGTKLLAFLKSSRLYILLGADVNQSKFNSFTKTFNFIK